MNWIDLWLKVRTLILRRCVERELHEELDFHIAMQIRKNVELGMTAEEAKRQALIKFGNTTKVAEECRDQRRVNLIETLLQDLRYTMRGIRRSPGFTAVVVLSLAIGIGANSAMFSVADALLLRPLPVMRPNEVVTLGSTSTVIPGLVTNLVTSYPDYVDLRDRSQSFDSLVAYTFARVGFANRPDELPKLTMVSVVSGNIFADMGVEPTLGRSFRPEENEVPGRNPVVVVDYDTWVQQFAADPSILGRKVLLGGNEFTVIGVAPKRFTGMDTYVHPTFYVPVMMWPQLVRSTPSKLSTERSARDFRVKARLKPGVSIAEAQHEVSAIAANLERTYPDTNRNVSLGVYTETQARFQQNAADSTLAVTLLLLAGAVLLTACANVGGLLMSRAPLRAKEIAMRMAIGAGRPRLIRQLFTEALVMALIGGMLGLNLAYAGIVLFGRLQIATDLPIKILLQLDQRVLWVSLGVALSSALLFGLLPAIQTTRADLTSAIKARGVLLSRQRLWGRNVLVIGQVGIALVLMTVATFVYHGFRQHLRGSPGFRTDHVVTMGFDPSLVGYTKLQSQQFYEQLLQHARSEPGVKSATLASYVSFTPQVDFGAIVPEGFELPAGQKSVGLLTNRVDESYFKTMGVRIVFGREFQDTDNLDAPLVAIVNEQVAKHYWRGESPLGKRFRSGDENGPWVQVVGVAETSRYTFIAESPQEFVYLPWRQHPRDRMILLAESSGSSAALIAPLRDVVRKLDAGQPVYDVRTIEDLFEMRTVKIADVVTEVVGSMGVMALALALVGLYGLMASSVSNRTREIGIRMSVGAERGQVLRMVLRQGFMLVLSGITVGLIGSLTAGRFLQGSFSSTYTTFTTVVTCLLVAIALMVVTMIAAYIPARRISRIDPLVALRHE